jgi:protochlorophyllide reductase
MDRRQTLKATGLAMLSLWLTDNFGTDNAASKWVASAAEEASAASGGGIRTVLITGCNTGIGFEAARILARKGGERIILACRTKQKAEDTAQKILAETPGANLVPGECDLASLESIKKFASTVTGSLDVVCYNAGLALNTAGEIERTADGFELTVGTNHLGHFYLHNLLETKIATKNKAAGKVVITASSVHDPENPGGKQGVPATLGNLEGFSRDGARFEMVDGNPYNGDKAYKDSKLCNIFFCRELTRRLADKNIVVNAFSPGLITSSGFFRYQNPVFSTIFNVISTNILKFAESPEYGGAALAYMTTVDGTKGEFYDSPPGTSYKYVADKNDFAGAFGKEFTVAQVSKEARDEKKGREFWKLSEKLVGI